MPTDIIHEILEEPIKAGCAPGNETLGYLASEISRLRAALRRIEGGEKHTLESVPSSPDHPVEIVSCSLDTENYVLGLRRPDGSVHYIAVPLESSYAHKFFCHDSPDEPIGLNLVCDGHYI